MFVPPRVGFRDITCPWFDFWFRHCIYCLLVCVICFPTYPFSSLFLTYLLPYLSFTLRRDPLRFQARCHKRRLNPTFFVYFVLWYISFDRWMRAFVVLCLVFLLTKPRDWLGETFPKWPMLCRVGRKTTTQSINQSVFVPHGLRVQYVYVCGQGYLFKRSSKALSKDWQKKYVTLLDDGRLTYHSSLHVRDFWLMDLLWRCCVWLGDQPVIMIMIITVIMARCICFENLIFGLMIHGAVSPVKFCATSKGYLLEMVDEINWENWITHIDLEMAEIWRAQKDITFVVFEYCINECSQQPWHGMSNYKCPRLRWFAWWPLSSTTVSVIVIFL